MSRMELPSSVMTAMFQLFTSTEEKKTEALLAVNTAITGYLADPSADPISLPYNLDAWDGYYVEREKVYQLAKASSGNFVCLAGDTHNAWASELKRCVKQSDRGRVCDELGELSGVRRVFGVGPGGDCSNGIHLAAFSLRAAMG